MAHPSQAVVFYEPETGRAGARVLAIPSSEEVVFEQHLGEGFLEYNLDPFERKLLGYLFTEFITQHPEVAEDDDLPRQIPETTVTAYGLLSWTGKGGTQSEALSGALRKLAGSRVVVPYRDPVDQELRISIRAIFDEFTVPAAVYAGLTPDHVDDDSGVSVIEPAAYSAMRDDITYRLAPAFVRQLLGKTEALASFDARILRKLRGSHASVFLVLGSHKDWRPDPERLDLEYLELPLNKDTWERVGIRAPLEGNRRQQLKNALRSISEKSPVYLNEWNVIDSRGTNPRLRIVRLRTGSAGAQAPPQLRLV